MDKYPPHCVCMCVYVNNQNSLPLARDVYSRYTKPFHLSVRAAVRVSTHTFDDC